MHVQAISMNKEQKDEFDDCCNDHIVIYQGELIGDIMLMHLVNVKWPLWIISSYQPTFASYFFLVALD